ncbi:hypothetical protein DEIPH_ctg005orf0025 [Deinococcus phoenicis]|uniref:Uncharacterized protein n=1 Tax=Deinococcus phoenicis TaxID=1476583 RepID=A0A016QU00_9DEIO|nr:hypothetical protein DEIPH_ctg005orf0025 [Deinococcus phoenicis]
MERPPELLRPFLHRAAGFAALVEGDALQAARLAGQLGEPDLARALLARSGGLLDTAEATRLLADPLPGALLRAARAELPPAPPALSLRPGEREMFVRGLAGWLLSGDEAPLPAAPLPPAPADVPPLPPGLSVLPAAPEEERWGWGVARALASAERAGPGHLTLACASWSAQQGALRFLRARYGTEAVGDEACPVTVLALEDVIRLLAAAWTWDLPRFARLLSGPLLLDGLHTLAPELFGVVTGLLSDAARVFGWTVLALPGVEADWPPVFQPSPAPSPAELSGVLTGNPVAAGQPCCVREEASPRTLHALAREVSRQAGSRLVMLSSRASAARLAGLLPGSTLLSSSLCPVHLSAQVEALLERRRRGEPVVVVATTLPPTSLGTFDTVWHLVAPLPHLVEAQALCHGTFHLVLLSDVATPLAWSGEITLTRSLLDAGGTLTDPDTQRDYARHLAERKADADWATARSNERRAMNYTALASELVPRPGTSVPVFVPYDEAARRLIAEVRASRVFAGPALRYAAWLTRGEAARAVRRGQAEALGWALIWQAPYDPRYGLAGELVAQAGAEE